MNETDPPATFTGGVLTLRIDKNEFFPVMSDDGPRYQEHHFPIKRPSLEEAKEYGKAEISIHYGNKEDMLIGKNGSVRYRYKLFVKSKNGVFVSESEVDKEDMEDPFPFFENWRKQDSRSRKKYLGLPLNSKKLAPLEIMLQDSK